MKPQVSLVVSTIGRPSPLIRLIHSLLKQDGGTVPYELIVVDQSPDGRCAKVLNRIPPRMPWRVIRTEPGVSLGRNVGASATTGQLLAFPDDDCWYQPRTLATAAALSRQFGPRTILSGQQVTAQGRPSMLRWPASARDLDRHDVWRAAISSTLFIPREIFEAVDGFDTELGVGARTPWQAGEDTDLLLRAMLAGARVRYEPTLQVFQDDPRRAPEADLRLKMRGYGLGIGQVLARNQYRRGYVGALMARKAAASATRFVMGRTKDAQADLAWANGVWRGYHDRVAV